MVARAKLALLLLVAGLLAACSSSPAPQPRGEAAASAPSGAPGAEVLGSHLALLLPEGAVAAPRPHDIMGAASASADETRIILEPGGGGENARFVVLFSELYALGTGDLRADAQKLASGRERARLLAGAKLPVAVLEPTESPKLDRPVFVLAAVFAHPDGTLQQAEFFVLPEMVGELPAYAERAITIAKSTTAGARRVAAKAGTVRLGPREVDLPPGFVVVTQRGPDFDVHRIRKLARVGSVGATLGVYLGDHPSLQHSQMDSGDAPPPPSTSEDGTLVGRRTSWLVWTTANGARVREAIVKLAGEHAVHAYAIAGDEAALAELAQIAATLREGR